LREHFETFQSAPATCGSTSKLFNLLPQFAGTFPHFSDIRRNRQGVSSAITFPILKKAEGYANKKSTVQRFKKHMYELQAYNNGFMRTAARTAGKLRASA
jgi:hypothetical protein